MDGFGKRCFRFDELLYRFNSDPSRSPKLSTKRISQGGEISGRLNEDYLVTNRPVRKELPSNWVHSPHCFFHLAQPCGVVGCKVQEVFRLIALVNHLKSSDVLEACPFHKLPLIKSYKLLTS